MIKRKVFLVYDARNVNAFFQRENIWNINLFKKIKIKILTTGSCSNYRDILFLGFESAN